MTESERRVQDLQDLIDRREFTSTALLALLAGVSVTIVGCSGGGDDSYESPTGPSGSRTGTVSANHGHAAIITSAQLMSAQAVTLDIRGNADHPHTVMLTMAEVGQVAGGQRVTKTSSTESSLSEPAHSHTVVFN